MSDKDKAGFQAVLEMCKRDSSYLAAFEALGRIIEEQKNEIRTKDFLIEDLERELARARGGKN